MVKCDSEAEIFLNNAQNAGDRARGAEHGARGTGHRAQGAGHRAQGTGRRGAGGGGQLLVLQVVQVVQVLQVSYNEALTLNVKRLTLRAFYFSLFTFNYHLCR